MPGTKPPRRSSAITSSPLLIRASPLDVGPERAGWRYVGFEIVRLAAGERAQRHADGQEHCAVVLGGTCSVTTDGARWDGVGERRTVFDGPPHAVYVPPGTSYEIAARTDLEIAIGSAPAEHGASARHLRAARREVRGSGSMERTIHHILMEDQAAERLLVTEVVTPGGHWSSYPPHKHDTNDPPRETQLEETYYHRLARPDGFAVQRVYTPDRSIDESVGVVDGDLVLVPRGYHTVSAPPGYDLYYLNVMAGPVRRWLVTFDPDHRWLMP